MKLNTITMAAFSESHQKLAFPVKDKDTNSGSDLWVAVIHHELKVCTKTVREILLHKRGGQQNIEMYAKNERAVVALLYYIEIYG